MWLRVLGRVEAAVDGRPVDLGGPKPRLVLALLLLEPNRSVSTDRLTEALWDQRRPADPRAALQVNVSNLRRALDGDGVAIEYANGGYVARVATEAVDVHCFVELVDRGTRLAPHEPQRAASALRDALALWRGRPFGDLADVPALAADVARLEELHLTALEKRIAVDLDAGDEDRVLEELQRLTVAHPLREGLWGQLMVALYRRGRQADALEAYGQAATHLREELGLDPSPALQNLQADVLRQAPSLMPFGPSARHAVPDGLDRSVRGYALLESLGPGRLGARYLARPPDADRLVVMELVEGVAADTPALVRSFGGVIERVGRLDHPRLVSLEDAWREPGVACLVAPRVSGRPLSTTTDGQPWAPERVADLVAELADALDHVHHGGVAASRLSARDVVVDDEGRPAITCLAAIALAEATQQRQPRPVLAGAGRGGDQDRGDVVALALVAYELLSGYPPRAAGAASTGAADTRDRPVPPPLGELRPELPVEIGAVLARALAPDQGFDSARAFGQALRSAVGNPGPGTPAPARVRNPYKGLRTFREADAGDFFGRTALVERLRRRLDGGSLALVGPSGSGKSSVVRAGLLPVLRQESWLVATMQPGEWPMAELERALTELATGDGAEIGCALGAGDDGLLRAVDAIRPGDGSRLLLFVDQFEQVYALARREDREAFLRRLTHAVAAGRDDVRVVCTVRADFYDDLLLDPSLGGWVADHTLAVSPLSAEQIEAAITGPAARVGLGVEPEVTAAIVGEIAGSPGSLPLLQFALTELFEARDGGRVTLAGYTAIGGISGALVGRAERLHDELDDRGREVCRQVFLRLVTVGDNLTETRRRVLRGELLGVGDAEAVEDVLETFGRHRLLTFDRDPFTRMPTVEIAHEALTRGWGRLRGWIDAARQDIAMHRRLQAAADEWRLGERDPSYLLRGSRLQEVEDWAQSSSIVLTDVERSYVEESLRARAEQEAADLQRLEREAALERRAAHRLRAVAVICFVAAVAAVWLSVFAFEERGRAREQQALAERQQRVAHARELAAAATAELDDDVQRSVLLALEAVAATRAVDGTVLPEAETALHRAVVSSRLQDEFDGVGGHLALHPNGDLLVTEGPEDTGLIDVRDAATGESVHAFEGHDPSVGDRPPDLNSVAFDPAGDRLATAGDDGTLRIWPRVWDTQGETEDLVLAGDGLGAVWGPSFRPDGEQIAAAWTDEGVVRVFDATNGAVELEVDELAFPYGAVFGPDGRRLVVPLGRGGRALVLDAATGEELFELPTGSGRGVAWSPDGEHIATTSVGTDVRVWNADDGSLVTGLFGHTSEVASAAWAPDSSRLATGSLDGTARVWRLTDGGAQQELVFRGSPGGVQGLAFSSDGDRLYTGEEGGEDVTNVKVWDVTDTGGAEIANHPGATDGPSVTDYGATPGEIVAASGGGAVTFWDLERDRPRFETRAEDEAEGPPVIVRDLAVSPDGELLAVAVGAGVQLWSTDHGELVAESDHGGLVGTIAWSPDGRHLATGDQFGTVRILDRDGREVAELDLPTDDGPQGWGAHGVAFDPRGEVLAVGGGELTQPHSWRVELWDWERERLRGTLETGAFTGRELAFDPTGGSLAVSGAGPVELFDIHTGQRTGELAGHTGVGSAVAFHPDGSRVATGGADGTIRLWDPDAARETVTLHGHSGPVESLAFSHDGARLVSGDRTGQIRVWALELDELIALARTKVMRELTPAECRQYLHADDCVVS